MKLSTILSNAFNYRKNKKKDRSFDEINKKLEAALKRKRAQQMVLIKDLRVYLRKFLKVDADSKFIPLDVKSNEEIRTMVNKKFGKRMAALDVSLTEKMTFDIR